MINQPSYAAVPLGRARVRTDGSIEASVVEVKAEGSVVFVIGTPPPGAQIILDDRSGHPYPIAEHDFIRPGSNFRRIFVRHETDDGGTLLLAIYPPAAEDDYPSYLRTKELPRVRGICTARHAVAAATIWRARLQNYEPIGGKTAYLHSLDLHQESGAGSPLRVIVMYDQPIDATAGTAQNIGWIGMPATATQSTEKASAFPLIRSKISGAAWADPPANGMVDRFTIDPENGVVFEPPLPILPQREIDISHATSPGVTCSFRADVSGQVIATAVE